MQPTRSEAWHARLQYHVLGITSRIENLRRRAVAHRDTARGFGEQMDVLLQWRASISGGLDTFTRRSKIAMVAKLHDRIAAQVGARQLTSDAGEEAVGHWQSTSSTPEI